MLMKFTMKTSNYIRPVFIVLLALALSSGVHATKWIVTVQNFAFTPSSITGVQVGDTVRWEWINGIHTTTSLTIPAGAPAWDAMIDATHLSFEYPVTVSGTYNYYCMHHPTVMVASFTVSGTTPTLSVTPSNQDITYISTVTTFNVTSNSSWTVVSDQSWCSVTPSGTGNGTISASCVSNPSVNQRIASITVTVAGMPSQTVTVTQGGAPRALAVTPSNQNVTVPAGSTDFNVSSNTSWTAVSNSAWCTVTPSGTGNGTITATYTANSGTPRTADITVTVSGLPPITVTVNQDGTTGIASISKSEVRIYPNPTTGIIYVVPGGTTSQILDVAILDFTGKILREETPNSGTAVNIDLSENPGGYYLVRVRTEDGTVTKKIILNK
jgi:plastocyanin